MESEKAGETGKKKRWTVEEKARVVRRYLKDHVGLADLAEETGTSLGLILHWAKQALEGLEQSFSRETHRQRGKSCTRRSWKKKPGSENGNLLSANFPREPDVKKSWGPLTGTHVAPETTEEILRAVMFLKKRGQNFLSGTSWTYHRWVRSRGKDARPEGVFPKGHWILPEERKAILDFKKKPSFGIKRLFFMMLDRKMAAVSP